MLTRDKATFSRMETDLEFNEHQTYVYSVEYTPSSLTQQSRLLLTSTLERLIQVLETGRRWQAVRFVDAKAISGAPFKGLISGYSRLWRIKSGIAVKAAGPLPRRVRHEEMAGDGNETADPRKVNEFVKKFAPPPITLCIFPETKIKQFEPDAEIPNPTSTFWGSSGCSVFLADDVEQFLRTSRDVFAAGIQEELADEKFYVPQFQLSDWTSASASDLARWFSSFRLYIGELAAENGCVVAAQEPLDEFLSDLMTHEEFSLA